jgi:hypothetical protein
MGVSTLKMRRRSKLFPVALVAIVTMALVGAGNKKNNFVIEIETILAEINRRRPPTAQSYTVRWSLAKQLAGLIRNLNQAEIDNIPPGIIDHIAGLLGDADQVVRSYAAEALGGMGPFARGAVPALENALKEIDGPPGTDKFGPATDSGPAIRRALQSITGEDMTPDPYRERPGSWESRQR